MDVKKIDFVYDLYNAGYSINKDIFKDHYDLESNISEISSKIFLGSNLQEELDFTYSEYKKAESIFRFLTKGLYHLARICITDKNNDVFVIFMKVPQSGRDYTKVIDSFMNKKVLDIRSGVDMDKLYEELEKS